MTKRIVITGGKDFADYNLLCHITDEVIKSAFSGEELVILSTHCSGTDIMVEKYAEERGLKLEAYAVEAKHNVKSAEAKRNKFIVEAADFILVFSDGGEDMNTLIRKAKKKGIPTEIIFV